MLMKMTFEELFMDLNPTAQIMCFKQNEGKHMWSGLKKWEEGRSNLLSDFWCLGNDFWPSSGAQFD